jgi:hypothetical protein
MKGNIMKNSSLVRSAGALALALMVGASIAWAGTPPASELAAQWWKWALEVPVAQSPLLDTTGEFAAVGQSGPVWFLAGTWGGGPATRTFTVPADKPLFFPIANYFAGGFLHAPKFGGFPPGPIAYERAMCTEVIDQLTDLSCEVDGVAVPITQQNREQSTVFALRLPADNIFQAAPFTCPACVDEGYYVLLAPLAPGEHTIHFAALQWGLDVTDYITVE